jgi:hypothetical protein
MDTPLLSRAAIFRFIISACARAVLPVICAFRADNSLTPAE